VDKDSPTAFSLLRNFEIFDTVNRSYLPVISQEREIDEKGSDGPFVADSRVGSS
jgi:hypothetical protein